MEEWQLEDSVEEENFEEPALQPQMYVHGLDDTLYYRTMRVRGRVKGKMVHVLVDSGSTHNFMDLDIAKKLGC